MHKLSKIWFFVFVFSVMSLVTVATGHSAEDYTASSGDTLEILVFQYPEYSGQSVVDNYGRITLPALGRIKVIGMSLRDIEDRITNNLSKSFGNASFQVVAKIVTLRPISIIGAVSNPGRYPYHPRMITLDAIAAAGGLKTFASDAYREYVNQMSAKEDLEVAVSEYWSAVAKKARLEAEFEKFDHVTFPSSLADFEGQSGNTIFTKTEREIFRARRLRLNKQIELLSEQKNSLKNEVTEIQNHKQKLVKTMNYLVDELEKSNTLAQKGLTRRLTLISQERQVSDIRSDYHRAIIAFMRARQNLGAIQDQIDRAQNENKEAVLIALKETELQLDILKKRIDSKRKFLGQVLEGSASDDFRIEILRTTEKGNIVRLEVLPESIIEPGDVISVLKPESNGHRTQPAIKSRAANMALH